MDPFLQALAEFDWTQPEQRTEYRLYYNDDGTIICYTMDDLPGNFIVVDRQTFAEMRYDAVVRNGKLVYTSVPQSWKLKPTDAGDYACHSSDITIIVSNDYPNKTYWKAEITYESN